MTYNKIQKIIKRQQLHSMKIKAIEIIDATYKGHSVPFISPEPSSRRMRV